MQLNWIVNDMDKWANYSNNDARKVKYGSFDMVSDGEHSGVSFHELSNTETVQDNCVIILDNG